jgi:Flp pilus assembly protein TadG
MPHAFNNFRHLWLGQAGTTSLEFALVATAFFAIMFAGMDLGRYFITQHSLRTLTSELVRATMVQCAGTSTACTLSGANVTTAENKVPFLVQGNFVVPPTSTRTAINPATGVMTITASASYPFTFVFLGFTGLSGPIAETTHLSY